MVQILSENKLIEGCKDGKEFYQEMLYKRFYGYALSISRLYVYNDDDAVSILNDSFLKAFKSIANNKYDGSTPFKNWIRKIVIHTGIDHYRKNAKYLNHLEIEEAEHQGLRIEIIDHLTGEDIIKLLDQIPDIQRLVFNLYEIHGYSHEEISKKLNIGLSTSRTYLTRAKKKLRVLVYKNL